jgi:hypothetical protein
MVHSCHNQATPSPLLSADPTTHIHNMPLSIRVFEEVAAGFQTHKERAGDGDGDGDHPPLSVSEIDVLRQKYHYIDDQLFQQVVVVRKGQRFHVPEMLQSMVEFRQAQGWPYRIQGKQLNPDAVHTQMEEGQRLYAEKQLPMVCIRYGKVDVSVAPAKDYHLELQYAIQQASQCHAHGEISVTCDFDGASFGQLARLNKDDLFRGMGVFQNYPVKVKRVYLVNTTWPMRLVMRTVLALASRGVRQKVVFATQDVPNNASTEGVAM